MCVCVCVCACVCMCVRVCVAYHLLPALLCSLYILLLLLLADVLHAHITARSSVSHMQRSSPHLPTTTRLSPASLCGHAAPSKDTSEGL